MKTDPAAIRCNEHFLRKTERVIHKGRPDASFMIGKCREVECHPEKRIIISADRYTCFVEYVIGLGTTVCGWKPSKKEYKEWVSGEETISYYDNDEEWWAVYDMDTRPYLENLFESADYLIWMGREKKFFMRQVAEVKWHCEIPYDEEMLKPDDENFFEKYAENLDKTEPISDEDELPF